MTKNKRVERQFWADTIRIIAILMVVLIHTTAPVILRYQEYSTLEWNFANLLNSASRMSIALFLMISGAFVLQKQESLTTFVQKRLSRITLPWFVWGTIQLIYNYDFSLTKILSGNVTSKLFATYFGGFWFMPLILGVYMLTPVIKPFVQQATKREWFYVFMLWFVFVPVFVTLNLELEKNISVQLPIWIEYIGYYLFGYFVVHKLHMTKKLQKEIGLIAGMSVLLIALNTWFQSDMRGEFFAPAYEYTNILVTISSLSAFIWLRYVLQTKKIRSFLHQYKKQITTVSLHSFGIFLSHSLILEIFTRGIFGLQISATTATPFISIPITFVLVSATSFGLVKILNQKFSKIFS